ncbi:MAG: hypothetical protein ACYCPQ_04470 [Elusimicrobiota bacterium]
MNGRLESESFNRSWNEGVERLLETRFLERLREKDAGLWPHASQDSREEIRNSLGWTRSVQSAAAGLAPARAFAAEIREQGFQSIALLGMGGSVLSAAAFRDCFDAKPGFPGLKILDSIHPDAVLEFESRMDLEKTFFLAASKSGSTIETNCMIDYFYARMDGLFPGKAGKRFAAITCAGTSLERTALGLGFRRVFRAPPDIGGRFSAWTAFGTVPAALCGSDLEALLERAATIEAELWSPSAENPALRLAAFLAAALAAGKNQALLILPPRLSSLGPWISQMISEATGKNGGGILTLARPSAETAAAAAKNAVAVNLRLAQDRQNAAPDRIKALRDLGIPVFSMALENHQDAVGQFSLWAAAVCAAGALNGFNPFGEPDVESAKESARKALELFSSGEKKEAAKPDFYASGIPAFCDPELKNSSLPGERGGYRALRDVIDSHFDRKLPGDYCAILAYAARDEETLRDLDAIAAAVEKKTGLPTVLDFGPAYLHSGGQLYKGGKNNGIFLEIIQPSSRPLPVPRRRYGFEALCQAQATGDFAVMRDSGRRILRLDLGLKGFHHLAALRNALNRKENREASCPN